jgi:tetratricopeptide (TPR) repeat protein
MLSNILDRISFLSLFLVIVLLPFFFLPFTKLPIEISKGLLLVVGLVISIIFWTMARFSDGKITLPKSGLLMAGLGIVVSFFLSAFFSSAPQMSFFGTMFDIGTFWFILAVFLLMLSCSILLRNQHKAAMVLFGLIISSALVLIFQSFHLFIPQLLTLGILGGKTDTLIGSWNAFGIFAGFSATMSIFIIEFFSISRLNKLLLGILIGFSILLIAAVNSTLVWGLLGIFSLLIFIYKISFSFSQNKDKEENVRFPVFSFAVILISLLFFMSGALVGGYIPNRLGLSNVEISPSLSATMLITKGVLIKHPILGIGPNRFGDAWAMYKSSAINGTNFWDTRFDFGSGLLPTLATTTGLLGILSLLAFLIIFLMTGIKSLSLSIRNSAHQTITVFFVASLYLFTAAFFYPTGAVIFILAFALAGIFIGLFNSHQSSGEITILFSNNARKSFFSLLLLVFVMVVAFISGFKYIERLVSVSYFTKAVSAQTMDVAEPNIIKANLLYQNDLYLRAYSQIYLVKLNSLISKGSSLSESEKAGLQVNLDQAVSGAQSALAFNKENYLNFKMLGSVYDTIVSLGVAGASDKALEAYQQALVWNPLNPGIKLALAGTSFANSKTKEAKDYANEALSLKPDYVDALVFLSQVAKNEGNNSTAITYAEKALALSPQDKNLIQYVNSLKNANPLAPAAPSSTTNSKTKKAGQ